ncbi:MAG: hypothetical protein JOZ39_07260 [Chloroflexi bacterium]|nr:hypothetical protein [Chloroflexota bacterium]
MTTAIWVRSALMDSYEIHPRELRWVVGGVDGPAVPDPLPLKVPAEFSIVDAPAATTLTELLLAGDIDALISPVMPQAFVRADPRIMRLFPDYKEAEVEYWRRTGVFPIMHTFVLRRDVYEAQPHIARSLFTAFQQSKTEAQRAIYDTDYLPYSVIWLGPAVEEQRGLLGDDYWPYGVEANRATIEAVLLACQSQGLIEHPPAIEDLFSSVA